MKGEHREALALETIRKNAAANCDRYGHACLCGDIETLCDEIDRLRSDSLPASGWMPAMIAELQSTVRHPSQLDDDETMDQAIERIVRHFLRSYSRGGAHER